MALGRLIGDLRHRMQPHAAAAVAENLALIDAPAPSVAATFHAFGYFLVEFALGLTRSPQELAAGWSLSGQEHWEPLRHRQEGWILAGAHTGNWEHLGALATLLDRDIVVPTGTQFHHLLSPLVKRWKIRRRIRSVSPERGLRGLTTALQRGQLVALPIDGGSYRRGIEVALRGRRVRLAAGAARLSLLAHCPILPIFSRRTALMRQAVTVHPPIVPVGGGQTAAREITQQLADLLGHHLEACPEQWCLFRPIDAARPDRRDGGSET